MVNPLPRFYFLKSSLTTINGGKSVIVTVAPVSFNAFIFLNHLLRVDKAFTSFPFKVRSNLNIVISESQ